MRGKCAREDIRGRGGRRDGLAKPWGLCTEKCVKDQGQGNGRSKDEYGEPNEGMREEGVRRCEREGCK